MTDIAAQMPQTPEFDLRQTLRHMSRGRAVVLPDVDIVLARIFGRDIRFAVSWPRDPIQRKHRQGRFYEQAELDDLKALFPLGGTFVDIGANVGNHSLFVGSFLSPAKIIPFEPNPEACRLFLTNMAVNGLLEKCDVSHLGLGLSDRAGEGYSLALHERNLGGAQIAAGGGDLRVVSGDSALESVDVDVIKIDVEGMEMAVLRGLHETIGRCRPVIFIEVDDENDADFRLWAAGAGYDVATSVRRYRNNTNFILRPAMPAVGN